MCVPYENITRCVDGRLLLPTCAAFPPTEIKLNKKKNTAEQQKFFHNKWEIDIGMERKRRGQFQRYFTPRWDVIFAWECVDVCPGVGCALATGNGSNAPNVHIFLVGLVIACLIPSFYPHSHFFFYGLWQNGSEKENEQHKCALVYIQPHLFSS